MKFLAFFLNRQHSAFHAGMLVLCLLLGSSQIGCQTARYVSRDQETGVVAIPENSQMWPFHYRDQAEKLMREHFPEGFAVEHEEVVDLNAGQVSLTQETTSETHGSVKLVSGSPSQGGSREYRIYYRRK